MSNLPQLPYYAVIFTSERTLVDDGYEDMATQMVELAKQQPGFLGIESARSGLGISVSYWRDIESIQLWKQNIEHSHARDLGRAKWYKSFKVRIAKVERQYDWESSL